MELSIWGMVASKMATTLRRTRPPRPQGVILVHHADQDHLIVWLYDADHAGLEEHLQCELGLLRLRLKRLGVTELGFGLSDDSKAWTLVARVQPQPFQTKAAKDFFREMLAENLSEALREVEVMAYVLSTLDTEEAVAKHEV